MRNANGAGTCYRLKGNRRKPYIARAFVCWEEIDRVVKDKVTKEPIKSEVTGEVITKKDLRPVYQTIGYFESRQEGLEALVLHKHNPVSPKADMTLKDMYDEWSKIKYRTDKKRKGISKATENNYRAAWKYMKKFERVKFKEMRSGHWQEIIDKCEDAGKSDSTIKKIKTLAVMLCSYALQNDIVDKNYAEFVAMPRTDKSEKERFTDLEVKQIETAAKKDEWTSTVLILIYTGMRISELLGLTRFNVDMDKQVITGGIKTDAGKDRVIPIHPKILEHVRSWYSKNGERLICEGENGKRVLVKRYREKFYYPALEATKVRKLTPHKCRHTFCSMLAEAGADTLAIQRLAGHADYGFTANEYTHPEIETLRKAINQI